MDACEFHDDLQSARPLLHYASQRHLARARRVVHFVTAASDRSSLRRSPRLLVEASRHHPSLIAGELRVVSVWFQSSIVRATIFSITPYRGLCASG